MGRVAKNVTAGIAANGWTALVHLLFVPLYIRLMGIEAYRLVGIFLTLQLLVAAVDSGLGAMINRELARLSAEGIRLLRPDDLAFDVGANFGIWSLLAARRVAAGSVHAFEPVPEMVKRLRRHAEINGASGIVVNEHAVGSEDGKSAFSPCTRRTRANPRLSAPALQPMRSWCRS
jgi:hypothetical protein